MASTDVGWSDDMGYPRIQPAKTMGMAVVSPGPGSGGETVLGDANGKHQKLESERSEHYRSWKLGERLGRAEYRDAVVAKSETGRTSIG